MLILRTIKTKTEPVLDDEGNPIVDDGTPVTRVVPDLDADGHEQVLTSVDVPQDIEAQGGDAINAYVAAHIADTGGH